MINELVNIYKLSALANISSLCLDRITQHFGLECLGNDHSCPVFVLLALIVLTFLRESNEHVSGAGSLDAACSGSIGQDDSDLDRVLH